MKKQIKTIIKDPDLVEQKRKIIISSANRLFVKKGFHKTTISDIARESGLTPGTLYNYIREKEDILFLMHEDLQKMFIEQINLGIQQGTDIRSKTENVFSNILDLIRKRQKAFRLVYIETASQTKLSLRVLLSRESEIIDRIHDLISIGMKQGVFHTKHERLAASIIHFLVFYQSLTAWDIKKMNMSDLEIKEYLLSCIFNILGCERKEGGSYGT